MNRIKANELLFDRRQLDPSKEEYDRDVRDAIIDYRERAVDTGDDVRAQHCRAELSRLDEKYGIKDGTGEESKNTNYRPALMDN